MNGNLFTEAMLLYQNGDRYNVTITRLFRNGDHWSESQNFGRDDLPLVAKAVDLAHTWIFEQNGGKNERR